MEELKQFDEVTLPDRRNAYRALVNCDTGEQRNITLEDWYQEIESVKLHEDIPEKIKSQFNIVKNLAVYAWFCYPFHQICEMKAFSTLEYALKEKYDCHVGFGEKGKNSFRALLEKAVNEGLLKDSGFTRLQKDSKEKDDNWLKELPSLICKFRNDLAHGSNKLHEGSWFTLRICVDLINQLFCDKEYE